MNPDRTAYLMAIAAGDIASVCERLIEKASPEAKGAGGRRPAPLASKQGNR